MSPSRAREFEEVAPAATEIVEIERNIIEKMILKVRQKIVNGEIKIRALVFGFLGFSLTALLLLVIHLYRSEAHNASFFNLIEQYEKAARLPDGQARNGEYARIAVEAGKLCGVFWKTRDSYNGCLLQAAAVSASGNPAQGKDALEQFYHKYGARYIGPFALFYAAYAHEAAGDFAQAAALYKESEAILKAVEKEDIAVFHQGRALYLQGKYEEADALFKKVIDTYSRSQYLEAARQYRMLVAAARATQP